MVPLHLARSPTKMFGQLKWHRITRKSSGITQNCFAEPFQAGKPWLQPLLKISAHQCSYIVEFTSFGHLAANSDWCLCVLLLPMVGTHWYFLNLVLMLHKHAGEGGLWWCEKIVVCLTRLSLRWGLLCYAKVQFLRLWQVQVLEIMSSTAVRSAVLSNFSWVVPLRFWHGIVRLFALCEVEQIISLSSSKSSFFFVCTAIQEITMGNL
jgi:hypothetical protein